MSKTCAVVALLLLALAPLPALAKGATMVFWYPGEAGSTAEGQPVIDAFASSINKKIAPESIAGSYFNTVEGGLTQIRKGKPAVGVVSFAAWTQHRAQLGTAAVILATLPLPHGTATERYALVGGTTEITPNARVLSSEPLALDFVRKSLFPKLPATATVSQTPQMLSQLKKIAEGQLDAAAILTPSEAAALARLSAPWAKALKTIAQSEAVPTARVVAFDPSWKGLAAFRQALLGIGADPAAAPLLEEMRLKGFAEIK